MKSFLLTITLGLSLPVLAGPPPQQQQQDQQDQQQQDQQQQHQQGQGQQQQHCPGGCRPPMPRVYECHAQMIDCYGRPLYTYWARGPQYQGACQYAANLCIRDASYGYGGNGARCIILGK